MQRPIFGIEIQWYKVTCTICNHYSTWKSHGGNSSIHWRMTAPSDQTSEKSVGRSPPKSTSGAWQGFKKEPSGKERKWQNTHLYSYTKKVENWPIWGYGMYVCLEVAFCGDVHGIGCSNWAKGRDPLGLWVQYPNPAVPTALRHARWFLLAHSALSEPTLV